MTEPASARNGAFLFNLVPRTVGLCCSLAGTLALLVRLTVRDAFVPASTVYYAFPLPILAICFLTSGMLWFYLRRHRLGTLSIGAAILCGLWLARSGFAWKQPRPTDQDHRVVFWNTCRGSGGWEPVFTTIRTSQPELFAIVEACPLNSNDRGPWEAAFPEYSLSTVQGDMLIGCRGSILHEEMIDITEMGRVKHCTILTADATRMHVLLVDISSNPLRSRAKAMAALNDYASQFQNTPCLIAGDFNTPLESLWFDMFRRRWNNAFQTAACGYAATWPVPVPVMQIDHVWGNHRTRFSQCETAWSPGSDHRLIQCEVRILSARDILAEREDGVHQPTAARTCEPCRRTRMIASPNNRHDEGHPLTSLDPEIDTSTRHRMRRFALGGRHQRFAERGSWIPHTGPRVRFLGIGRRSANCRAAGCTSTKRTVPRLAAAIDCNR